MSRRKGKLRNGRRVLRELYSESNKESNMNDIVKQKREVLIKAGWVESLPEFDWNYFYEVSSKTFTKDLGYAISKASEKISTNFFNIFSEEVDSACTQFMHALCPPVFIPQPPLATAFINASWPFNINDHNSHIEAAFEELTYRIIIRIIKNLGTPNAVYQALDKSRSVVLKLDPFKFDIDNIDILDQVVISWDKVYVTINRSHSWDDNGAITSYEYNLYSDDIRKLSSSVMYNIGLEINPTTYQLGDLDPKFKLNTFPQYIKEYTEELKEEMGFYLGGMERKYPERFNIIVVGPPGFAKTCWSQSFATEELASRGYLILIIDYSTLQDLVIPSYIGKVCIIINDADTLALDRDLSTRGETEQVLSWLDGTRTTFIKPFYLAKRTSVVTIMTANSVDKWDPAALRKGRIHKQLIFDQVNLSDV
jgi:hypothetical protein